MGQGRGMSEDLKEARHSEGWHGESTGLWNTVEGRELQDVKLGGQQDLRGCRGTWGVLTCCEEPARPFMSMDTVGSGLGVKGHLGG